MAYVVVVLMHVLHALSTWQMWPAIAPLVQSLMFLGGQQITRRNTLRLLFVLLRDSGLTATSGDELCTQLEAEERPS